MDREFCRRAILGAFVQGYFHNLKGALQGLFLPLQRVQLNTQKYLTEEGIPLFEKIFNSVEKLNTQLTVALDDLLKDDEGPWDLGEVLRKEILFWEADLRVKHKIKKNIEEREKVSVSLPYNLLLGIFCLLQSELYSSLEDNSELTLVVEGKEKPCVTFVWSGKVKDELFQRLERVAKLLSDFAQLEVQSNSLRLCFNP